MKVTINAVSVPGNAVRQISITPEEMNNANYHSLQFTFNKTPDQRLSVPGLSPIPQRQSLKQLDPTKTPNDFPA